MKAVFVIVYIICIFVSDGWKRIICTSVLGAILLMALFYAMQRLGLYK
jgi:hypothetical protein